MLSIYWLLFAVICYKFVIICCAASYNFADIYYSASYIASYYLLNLITMTGCVNSFLLLTLLGIIYNIYYKYKIFLSAINIVIDSTILDQVNNLEKLKQKKTDSTTLLTINEEEGNDI